MQTLRYTVRFTTPAFLGNAEQNGQWRTPPFKALLRQWWRVVKAKDCHYDHAVLRQQEGDLFGNAWLSDARGNPLHRKSRLAIRLGAWAPGKATSQGWPGGPMEYVTTTRDGKGRVRSDVYLGFGPVSPEKKKERRPITIRGAIGTDEEAVLSLLPERLPELRPSDADMKDVLDALQLTAWFGAVGSRSRNGWGALGLIASAGMPEVRGWPHEADAFLTRVGREWIRCLDLDWPHALGYSGHSPLVWTTKPYPDWRQAMGCLANIRVEVRCEAKSSVGPERIGGIHLLGYPAGDKWVLRQLSKGQPRRENQESRLATQLRFKVLRTSDGLVGMVFHMPHRFPDELMGRLTTDQQAWLRENERAVWQRIHAVLDRSSRLSRFGGSK
jgi:CRISPR-associated protein Cmr1